MFRSTARGLLDWWTDFSDDILGADLEPAAYEDELAYHSHHPHRQTLRSHRARRHGAVPERPAHCLCPVRAQDPGVPAHQLTR